MNTTDPIADYLTRLRNAVQAHHKRVDVPASNLKREITKLLHEQRFISGYTENADGLQGTLRIQLRYTDGCPAISGMKRISRPGLRHYVGFDEMPRVLNGLGVAIVSTSQGVMTDRKARELHIGGEVLCHIW
jgi:small subunit ribosomal protein S8